MTTFYAQRARQSFLNAYGHEPNVRHVEAVEDYVEVYLERLDSNCIYPVHIDGISIEYIEADSREDVA